MIVRILLSLTLVVNFVCCITADRLGVPEELATILKDPDINSDLADEVLQFHLIRNFRCKKISVISVNNENLTTELFSSAYK